jgi:RNA polymerase sigma-70 factor (ECF subfamily)
VPAVDRELVIAAQRGDQVAFIDLLRGRVDRLFSIARRILHDVDRAEDALQDALVIAWRDLPDLRDPDRFDFWLQRVLANMCIEHARRERRRYTLQVLRLEDEAAPDELMGIVDRDIVDRAFRRLKAEERTVLVLRYYLGYEPAVIAEVLGVPAGTIRSRLHHAHRAMRAAIEADARANAVGGTSASTAGPTSNPSSARTSPTPAIARPTASLATWRLASPVSLDAARGASEGGPS